MNIYGKPIVSGINAPQRFCLRHPTHWVHQAMEHQCKKAE